MSESLESKQVIAATRPIEPVVAMPRFAVDFSPELVCATRPDNALAAAVYRIRSALFLAHKGKTGPLMIAIVGAQRGEGRTVLAANLAIAYAQVGARTVLIDGDMAHGRLHSLFQVRNEGGLARALASRTEVDEGMPVLKDHDLVLIPSGATGGQQQPLSPSRLKAVIARLALKSDVIVIDTPAWSVGADAQIFAAETGLALAVTRLHKGTRDGYQSLLQALAQGGTSVFAVPFN